MKFLDKCLGHPLPHREKVHCLNAWSNGVGASSFGFPNTLGNSLNQFQSLPMHPYDSTSDGVGLSASASASVDGC